MQYLADPECDNTYGCSQSNFSPDSDPIGGSYFKYTRSCIACLRFGAGRVPLLPERRVRFGAGMLVPLQGVAVRVNCELSNLWSRHT